LIIYFCSSSTAGSAESEFLHRSVIPTDHFQASLPRLPVPKLDDTCNRYLAALTPLLSADEFQRTKQVVEAFRNGDGKGWFAVLVAVLCCEISRNERW
jgi:carnitine O-palmitoyltransferase 2